MSSTKKRRLAAIMFADIVGYTAMMQQNEMHAGQCVEKFQKELKLKVAQYNGQIIQFYGDGCLSIFDSSVDAVHCGIAIQKACKLDVFIPLRIGLHSGDIYMQSGNIFGDSVNVASRIESMGVPGSLLLSKKIRDEIKNHQELKLVALGSFDFKNIEESVEVYAIANEGIIIPDAKELTGKFKEKTKKNTSKNIGQLIFGVLSILALFYFANTYLTKFDQNQALHPNEVVVPDELAVKSIAILPFENTNGDADKEYFSSGISDEIRSHLASFDVIKVISRSSCMFYKDKNLPISEIGKKLKVSHVMTGQVRWTTDKISLKVELNNAITDELEWDYPYEKSITELSSFENEITEAIAKQMQLKLSKQQEEALATAKPIPGDVYDRWLKAWHNLNDYTPEKMEEAYKIAEEIIQIDPNYASAYYILGYYHLINAVWFGSTNPREDLEKAKSFFEKGLAIDPENALCYLGISNVKLFYEWDFDGAEIAVKNASKLGALRANLISVMPKFYNGEFDAAAARLVKHKEVDPLSVYHGFFNGRILFFQGKTEQAIEELKEGIRLHNLIDYYHSLGKVYLNTGEFLKAIPTLEAGLKTIGKNHPPLMADLATAYAKNGEMDKTNEILDVLEEMYKEGSGGSPAFYCGQIHSSLSNTEKAFEWLEKAYEARETEMVWLKIEPQFENIRLDNRYAALIKKVGFPQVLIN